MPDYGLLWINADATSYRSRKKLPAVQPSIINTHSQHYARRARAAAGHRALRNSSAASGLVGWNRRSDTPGEATTDSHLAASHENGLCTAEEESSVALIIQRPSPRLVPHICGKDEALDPFHCSAAKIDSTMHGLIHFSLVRIHPTMWNDMPKECSWDSPDFEAKQQVVYSCMSDKARLYSFVACTAGYMYQLKREPTRRQRAAFYLQNALAAMRAQIETNDLNREKSLYTILLLAICGEMLDDYAGAVIHLRAAKHLVDQIGGLGSIDAFTLRTLFRADLGTATLTLSQPVFALPWTMPTSAALDGLADSRLNEHAQKALLDLQHSYLPASLREDVHQLIKCAKVLPHAWKHPTTSSTVVGQILKPLIVVSYNILSISFQSQIDAGRRKRLEATKVTLILWINSVVRSIMDEQQVPRGNFPTFSAAVLRAKKQMWPAAFFELLSEWNRVVETTSPEAIRQQTPPRLVRLVLAMEAYAALKLGGLMEALFKIEAQIKQIALNVGQY
jgi:hypothetical protein